MRRVIVTVVKEGDSRGRDLEMPNDVPVEQLLPELVELLGWGPDAASTCALMVRSTQYILAPKETLQAAGVQTGDILIALGGYQAPGPPSPRAGGEAEAPVVEQAEPESAVASQSSTKSSLLMPYLVSEQGKEYPLRDPVTEIGREDRRKGVYPDIDLTKEDPDRYVHRQHARIIHEDDKWFLEVRVGVARGKTAVNRKLLAAGDKIPLHDGDEIRIARVVLTFHET